MNISEPDFDAAIEKSPSRCWLTPVPSTVMSWLYEIGVSDALVGFFERHSYVSWVQIGSVSFNSVSELVRENVDPHHAVYKSRLLIIGSGLNGDPIVAPPTRNGDYPAKQLSHFGYKWSSGLASQSIPTSNQILSWLKELESLPKVLPEVSGLPLAVGN
jgi:hypothetical protein